VLLAGLVAMLLPLALMCFFDDDKTLGLLSESLQCAAPPQPLRSTSRVPRLLTILCRPCAASLPAD
jgi:hypothetical protein